VQSLWLRMCIGRESCASQRLPPPPPRLLPPAVIRSGREKAASEAGIASHAEKAETRRSPPTRRKGRVRSRNLCRRTPSKESPLRRPRDSSSAAGNHGEEGGRSRARAPRLLLLIRRGGRDKSVRARRGRGGGTPSGRPFAKERLHLGPICARKERHLRQSAHARLQFPAGVEPTSSVKIGLQLTHARARRARARA